MTPGWKLFPEAAGIFGIELIHQFDQILLEDRHHTRGVWQGSRQNEKNYLKKNGKQKKDSAVWKLALKIKLRFLQKIDHIWSYHIFCFWEGELKVNDPSTVSVYK